MWTEARLSGSLCWTSPDFPGYEIEKHVDEPHYVIWSPSGPIGTAPTFDRAERHVKHDRAAVARATQVKDYNWAVREAARVRKDYNWAVREAAAELGCDESEIF